MSKYTIELEPLPPLRSGECDTACPLWRAGRCIMDLTIDPHLPVPGKDCPRFLDGAGPAILRDTMFGQLRDLSAALHALLGELSSPLLPHLDALGKALGRFVSNHEREAGDACAVADEAAVPAVERIDATSLAGDVEFIQTYEPGPDVADPCFVAPPMRSPGKGS